MVDLLLLPLEMTEVVMEAIFFAVADKLVFFGLPNWAALCLALVVTAPSLATLCLFAMVAVAWMICIPMLIGKLIWFETIKPRLEADARRPNREAYRRYDV